jgi:acyl-[acyl-carrier-protein]-phospholipid O-acyltransferase/long-chain-fatty-acid--[acyl-carrier-protein] ligase
MLRLFRIKGFPAYVLMLFLNAFIDLGHKIVIQNTIFKIYDGQLQIMLTAIVNALILLPFILMFTPAGYLSDKYPKNRVMKISAWAAVGLTICITLFYYLGWFWPAFAMTLLMAVQSAFYSPSKYGYIKELAGKEFLAQANGVVQAFTTIAILSGTFVFSIFFESWLQHVDYGGDTSVLLKAIAPIGWILVAGALVELLMASTLPRIYGTDTALRFDWSKYRSGTYLRNNLKVITSRQVIILSIIGLSVFWAIGQVLLAAFPAYVKEHLSIENTAIVQGIMACAGIGIMAGSLIAGRISRDHIETGLIPVGSFGIAFCLLMLPEIESARMMVLDFLLIGMFGGIFIIPLNALIQFNASESVLGRVLAGNNFIQNITMLSFLVLTVVFAWFGFDSVFIFYILLLVALFGAVFTLYKLPQSMVRFLVRFALGRRYSLEVIGLQNIPEQGGVFMLGNHISWIDWAIIQIASPRPVRFVMEKGIYQRWYLQRFLDFFGVIPVSAGASKAALAKITELLNAGEVVCMFPEGTISRSGQLSEFRHGYEKAAAAAEGVILPFYLRGLWGTRFSRSSDRLKSIRNDRFRQEIIIAFGQPLPIATKAEQLKQRIFELSLDSWQRYTDSLQTIPVAFLETVKRMGSEPAIADSNGNFLSYYKLGAAVTGLSLLLGKNSREQNIGLLLPASSAGAITNLAVLMCSKTAVNLNFTSSNEVLVAAKNKAGIKSLYTSRRFIKHLQSRGIETDTVFASCRIFYLEDIMEQSGRFRPALIYAMLRLLPAWTVRFLFTVKKALDDPAVILFSSGSEAAPKGVILSHRNVMANLKQVSDVLNTEGHDVIISCLPLFHAFGLTVTCLMPLIEGLPVVCHPDPTDAVNIGKAIARFKVTVLCATSTLLGLYTRNQRVHPLMFASLRIVVAGAEKLRPDVSRAFKLKFNKDIYEGYGATETTPVASVNIPEQLDANYWRVQSASKPGTVGLPLPGTCFRIVNPDTLEELNTGEAGLILIGGAQVMTGYLDDEELTRKALVNMDGYRWYKTGDKGYLDADGFLTIVDRYSRFAKIGGEMISLTAVEESIRTAAQGIDLDLAAISALDAKKGEQILLMAAGKVTEDDLRKKLQQAGLSNLIMPSKIVMAETIPRLGTGKIDYLEVKKILTDSW